MVVQALIWSRGSDKKQTRELELGMPNNASFVKLLEQDGCAVVALSPTDLRGLDPEMVKNEMRKAGVKRMIELATGDADFYVIRTWASFCIKELESLGWAIFVMSPVELLGADRREVQKAMLDSAFGVIFRKHFPDAAACV